VEGKKFRLVAWGVRTVSFLRVQVYNVGLYIPESEYAVLPTWSLTADGEPWTSLVRIYSYPLILRIIPVRNTDYAHLRDGFVKSTVSRLKKYDEGDTRKDLVDESVVKFKALFPKGKLRKGEVLSIMQQGPELKLYARENMEELFGGVRNDDLARGLMSAYLIGDNVVSPDLRKKLKQKILQIAARKQDSVDGVLK
jgi:Chalcone isomerase like